VDIASGRALISACVSDQLYLLRKLPVFRGLSDKEIDKVFASMEDTLLPSGKVLFEEGSKSNALYVVWTGAVEIFQSTEAGTQKLLATLEMGDCLGEMGLLRDTTRSASARASKETILMMLAKEKLDAIAQSEPRIWGRMMQNLAIQIADRLEQLERTSKESGGKAAAEPERGLLSRLLGW
jgi:CRP/FNR family cyclic AMP-dependent transcriptional regulator